MTTIARFRKPCRVATRILVRGSLLKFDNGVVYTVLLHLKTLPMATFFRTLNAHPEAANYFALYARKRMRPVLKDYYYQLDRRDLRAELLVDEAFQLKVRL
jgi:hypothetical protein